MEESKASVQDLRDLIEHMEKNGNLAENKDRILFYLRCLEKVEERLKNPFSFWTNP